MQITIVAPLFSIIFLAPKKYELDLNLNSTFMNIPPPVASNLGLLTERNLKIP